MTVGDRLYVRFYYWAADVVVARTWPLLLFCLEDCFAGSAALERCTAMKGRGMRKREILSWSNRVGELADLIHFTLSLEHECHG